MGAAATRNGQGADSSIGHERARAPSGQSSAQHIGPRAADHHGRGHRRIDHRALGNERDDPHLAPARRAPERIDFEDLPEEFGPAPASRAARAIGVVAVVARRAVLDGASRSILHWEHRVQMTEQDVELTLQRTKEKFPAARPRIISDNGRQFITRDFKEFICLSEMTHVRTSPYSPQSNGKFERWNHSFKSEGVRPGVPLTFADGLRVAAHYVEYYNTVRLHSAIGYVTPQTRLEGRQQAIFEARDRKLDAARTRRAALRHQHAEPLSATA